MQPQLLAATKFIAHLVNQVVVHEVVALELLAVLLENPTDDSVEVRSLVHFSFSIEHTPSYVLLIL